MARVWLGWWFGVSGFMCGLLAAAALAAGVTFMYFQEKSHEQVQAADTPTVYLRDDFAASIFGKSEHQVLEAVGKPDKTSRDAEATYWHYCRRTRNSATGRTDSDAQVVFERGRVVAVNY